MEALVFKSSKGNAVTNSLLVAEKFGKQHKHVLDAIRNIISSAENSAQFYHSTTYKDSSGKSNEMFIMNRDGFSLLVMGFTGKEALKFKIEYINAFNKMDEQLKQMVSLPNFNNPVEAARAWADQVEKKQLAEATVKQLAPKADYADRLIDTETRVDIGQAAKLLKLPYGRNSFFKELRSRGVFFKNRNEPKQTFIERGYFELFMVIIPTNNHGDLSKPKITVTQKGLYWLAKIFGVTYNDSLPALNAI